MQGITKQ
ncbi:hypothetical protein Pint_11068 [Pistacia integerrima]|nr:hypothetical protein Pint_11068 [Pistacia integerrima]